MSAAFFAPNSSAPPPPPITPAGPESLLLQIVGWVGAFTAYGLFLAPIPTVRQIIRERSVGDFSVLPYLMGAWQCGMWSVYALPWIPQAPGVEWALMQPLATNAVGFLLEVGFCLVFARYSRPGQLILLRLFLVISAIGAISAFALVEAPHLPIPLWPNPQQSIQTTTLGMSCVVLNIGMYAAPLGVVRTVIRRRSVRYMPLGLTIAGLACSAIWTAFALLSTPPNDFILIPNVLGLFFSLAQLAIYRCYSPFWGAAESKSVDEDADDYRAVSHREALIAPTAARG